MRHSIVKGVLLAWVLIRMDPAWAERADRDKPVHIEADSVYLDDLQRAAHYQGKVILTQGTLSIQADRIEVRQDEKGFSAGTALGDPVQFRQKQDGREEWVEGWANRIEYDARTDQIRLMGAARLKRGEEELRGEIITYDARSEFYQARGSGSGQKAGRVRAVILPKGKPDAERPSPTPAQP